MGGESSKDIKKETFFGKNTSLEKVPDWVPLYPNSTETQSIFHVVSAEDVSGAVIIMTSDNVQTVQDYYRKKFEEEGYKIGSEIMTQTGAGISGVITGELATKGREINVVNNE